MASFTNYKGLQVQTPDPTGSASLPINNDLKQIGDWIGTSGIHLDSGAITSDGSGNLQIAGTVNNGPYWSLNVDGSAEFGDSSLSIDASGNLNTSGSVACNQLSGQSFDCDSSQFISDGSGNVTAISYIVGGSVGTAYMNGLGGNLQLNSNSKVTLNGASGFYSDGELIQSNGIGTLQAVALNTTAANSWSNQQYAPETALSIASNLTTWNLTTAQAAYLALSSNTTISISNPQAGGTYTLVVLQSGGSHTITWSSSFQWAGGTAPVVTTTNNAIDVFTFIYHGTTSKMLGTFAQKFS